MENIISKANIIAKECAKLLNLTILEVEYVKEHGIKILRIIADSAHGLTIEESSNLNEMISKRLDSEDFIDEEYYLEVSSPGLEKPLKTDKDICEAIGKYIHVKLYEKMDGNKEFDGDLLRYNNNILTLEINVKGIKKIKTIEKDKISKLRLAVKF